MVVCPANAKINWKKIGYNPGEIDSIYSSSNWVPCWNLEKIGKKGYLVHNAGNCIDSDKNCPCDNIIIKNQNDYLGPLKKKWQIIIKHKKLDIDIHDQKRWESFINGRE